MFILYNAYRIIQKAIQKKQNQGTDSSSYALRVLLVDRWRKDGRRRAQLQQRCGHASDTEDGAQMDRNGDMNDMNDLMM